MIYVDSSALLKLLLADAESIPFQRWLVERTGIPVVTSELTRLETLRACRREYDDVLLKAEAYLGFLDRVALTNDILDDAVHVGDRVLRSLDAIHLASALAIREEVTAFVTYDRHLFDAAKEEGLDPVRPGA
jgi:uncharacterized protein